MRGEGAWGPTCHAAPGTCPPLLSASNLRRLCESCWAESEPTFGLLTQHSRRIELTSAENEYVEHGVVYVVIAVYPPRSSMSP